MRSFLEEVATTAGVAVDLISLADAKLALAITDTSQDDFISQQITIASQTIASLCDRVFGVSDVIETFVIDLCERPAALALSRYPVVSVGSVTVDDNELDEADYDAGKTSGLVYRHNGCPWSGRVVVIYSGGYTLPDDAPGALIRACLLLLKEQVLMRGRDPTVRQIQHGDESVSFWVEGAAKPVSDVIDSLITPFRRLSV